MSGYYRSLTLSHTQAGSTDTADYPCFWAGNASLATIANGGRVTSSSGYDIVFCTNPASPLTSKLPFERVAWSATTGLGEFWIQIPTLSHSTNTVVYVYYGDATITTDQQNAHGTWDGNFIAVYHFGTSGSLVLTDSTSNANNGTNHGATAGAGQIGGAANFVSASSEYVDCGSGPAIGNPVTAECWFKYTGLDNGSHFSVALGSQPSAGNAGYRLQTSGSSRTSTVFGDGLYLSSSAESYQFINGVNFSNPHYAAAIFQTASDVATYIDAATFAGNRAGTTGCSSSTNLYVGSMQNANPYFDGWVDEVRISNIARSADYLLATYNNTVTSSTFVSVGSETPISGGGLLVNPGNSGGMQLLQGGCNA